MSVRASDAYLEAHHGERIDELVELLRIPTIGVLSRHADDVRAGAEWIAAKMDSIGLEHAHVSETAGRPVVYADWLHAENAPTVIVYCHYDVQPVDPLDLWVRPPFEPRIENGRIYARGAADDKGQLHLHLWAAQALLQSEGRLPINVRYVFEGEEEVGSTHFDDWLEQHRDLVQGDVVVISDTSFYEGNHPALTVGLRGMMYLQVDVNGSRQDLHSGQFGGMVQNPAVALAQIIASLKDGHGRVTVPGFYDEAPGPTVAEREEFSRLAFDEAAFTAELEVSQLFGEPGYSPLERRGARPTLDVCGMWAGFTDEGAKTIIPAHAHAKISSRVVPGMDPVRTYERVRDAILAVDVPGVEVEVYSHGTMDPFHVDKDHPAVQAAAISLREIFGEDPYYLYEGGSIGAVASLHRMLAAPVVILGFANPDDQAHSPNESLVLDNYEQGIRTVVRFWESLATLA
jgi:acetylornithine deacetylase/succinyl-diaminopimelate desuccinylase-like protein